MIHNMSLLCRFSDYHKFWKSYKDPCMHVFCHSLGIGRGEESRARPIRIQPRTRMVRRDHLQKERQHCATERVPNTASQNGILRTRPHDADIIDRHRTRRRLCKNASADGRRRAGVLPAQLRLGVETQVQISTLTRQIQ